MARVKVVETLLKLLFNSYLNNEFKIINCMWKEFFNISRQFRAVARKKLQPRRTHGPLYEISRMKSSNIISLIKKIKIDSIW